MLAAMTSRVAFTLVSLLALAGCPKTKTDGSTPGGSEGATSGAGEHAEGPTKREPASPPGVYFAIDDRIVRLDARGEFATLASPGEVRTLQVDEHARVLALLGDSLWVDSPTGFVARERFAGELGTIEQLAEGEGGAWALGRKLVAHAEAGTWTRAGELAAEVDAFASLPGASTYLLIDDRVLRFEGPGAQVEVATLPFGHAKQLAVGAGERLVAAGQSCELALLGPGAWQRGREPGFGCEYPSALALDERQRVWVASTTGVHVLHEGELVKAYPSGSQIELVGELRSIAIVGESPAVLPEPGPVRRGSIAGTLEFKGKPAVKAKLEICPRPAPIFHDSPCGHSSLRATATTDAKGRFAIRDVPLARYGWALQIGEHWTMSEASSMPGPMHEGETLELGVQRLE